MTQKSRPRKPARTRALENIETITVEFDQVYGAVMNDMEKGRHGSTKITIRDDETGEKISIDAEAFLVGHEWGSAVRWDSELTHPCDQEIMTLREQFELDTDGDGDWEEYRAGTIEVWKDIIKSRIRQERPITFERRGGSGRVTVPVEIK